jgi:2-amino-4-hydroxy-6-hydroxymethyldihydropteridine diphosphokinase
VSATVAYVGLGANLGDAAGQIRSAIEEIDLLPHTQLVRSSALYRSAPLGESNQPEYTNAVAEIGTELSARALLESLLALEARFGRQRTYRNAPRVLDLDLLLYGDAVIDEPGLSVPHPRMHERRFVLEPLVEIAPQCAIPHRGPALDALLRVRDQCVRRDPA